MYPCSAAQLASFDPDGQLVAAKRKPSVFARARDDERRLDPLDRRSTLSRRAWAPGWAEDEKDITGADPA